MRCYGTWAGAKFRVRRLVCCFHTLERPGPQSFAVIQPKLFAGVTSWKCRIHSSPSDPIAMLRTYEGILQGDRIRWSGDDVPATDRPLRVHVTVIEDKAEKEKRGQQMADALSKLAESGAFSGIEDPSAWQHDIRRDRPLPGRDN